MYKGAFILAAMFSGAVSANDGVVVAECTKADIYYSFSAANFSDSALTAVDLTDSQERRKERSVVGHSTKSNTIGAVPYELTAMDVVKVDNDGAFLLNVKHITVDQDEATAIAADLARRGVDDKSAGTYAAEKAASFKSAVATLPFRLVDGEVFESKTELGKASVVVACF